jgi:DNA-binding NarL/FixJ family response regulator
MNAQFSEDKYILNAIFDPDRTSNKRSSSERGGVERAETDEAVWVIEARSLIRHCISLSLRPAFAVCTFANVSEVEGQLSVSKPGAILLLVADDDLQATARNLSTLEALAPHTPVIVVSPSVDPEAVRLTINHGARGYIPTSMRFELAIGVVRFVMAGGTYAPIDYLFAETRTEAPAPPQRAVSPSLTKRELTVLRAIQQGRSNKLIAFELAMCENTVRAHMRSIMKKLNARNRTEAAIKARHILD